MKPNNPIWQTPQPWGPLQLQNPRKPAHLVGLLAWVMATVWAGPWAWANGGPFVVKYPGGDPAAKGVLARLDPDLKPARESRLAVVKEDLALWLEPKPVALTPSFSVERTMPLVRVTATYLITNRTAEPVEVDFGFPILRGIYVNYLSMSPAPDVSVIVDRTNELRPIIISNSAIYGLLRRRAEETLNRMIAADPVLRTLCEAVAKAAPTERESARHALADYLVSQRGWTASQAALLVEYISLRPANPTPGFNSPQAEPLPSGSKSARRFGISFIDWRMDNSVAEAVRETAWATPFIGEQKATQWLTLLAGRLDPASANSYERIFEAWGGDVRERSVDLHTGRVRPREIALDPKSTGASREFWAGLDADPTVSARVDYLEVNTNLTEAVKASWHRVLKHLPVIFTFAPMNLLHYHVSFPPRTQRTVRVTYRQYAYLDTAAPRSYQFAYLLHPASLWDSFGPINLTVTVPAGVTPASHLTLRPVLKSTALLPGAPEPIVPGFRPAWDVFEATLTEKTGELFIGIDAEAWDQALPPKAVSAAR